MNIAYEVVTPPITCVYLPTQSSRTFYRVTEGLSDDDYEALMNEGYRKFGAVLFKPVCTDCQACQAIRIPIAHFKPDRSQRRVLRDNSDLEVRFAPAIIDKHRTVLYYQYHESQILRKHWPKESSICSDYVSNFVLNPVTNIEISVWKNKKLLGVMCTEITPNVVSDIYHYYSPTQRDRSLGTFLILQSIALAKRLNKPWVYLGYYVAGCHDMEYKMRYKPYELLIDGQWGKGN
jgi:arginine-tRNA-protein transferase